MSSCRSCDAHIWWAVTEGGRRIPIDWDPEHGGNVVVASADDPPRGRVLPLDDAAALWPRYKSHFATCPNAAAHRKEKHRG